MSSKFLSHLIRIHAFGDQWSEERKKSYIKHALREYQIHKALNHPRVVQLSDVFEIDHASFCTVLDYCDGKDLETYLQTQKTLAEKEARTIILQVFSGLKYLNELEPPVVHYDLKYVAQFFSLFQRRISFLTLPFFQKTRKYSLQQR